MSWNNVIQTTKSESHPTGIPSQKLKGKSVVVRRSRMERYLDILKVTAKHGPIKQTHIMYKANLSWMELKKSLEHLMKLKMITEVDDEGGTLFAISETGLSTIYNYEKVETILTGKEEVAKPTETWNF